MIEDDRCRSDNLGRSIRDFLDAGRVVARMLLSVSGIDEEVDDALDNGGESRGS